HALSLASSHDPGVTRILPSFPTRRSSDLSKLTKIQAYFAAWALNMLMPTIFAMLIALIVYPPSRSLLFPPAPIALVDEKTGGVKDRKSTRLNSSHVKISYAVFCLKKKNNT